MRPRCCWQRLLERGQLFSPVSHDSHLLGALRLVLTTPGFEAFIAKGGGSAESQLHVLVQRGGSHWGLYLKVMPYW
jgi:hypothetical protein